MLALIFAALLALAQPARADVVTELTQAIAGHKARIARAATRPEKLSRLSALKSYIDNEAQRLPERERERDARRKLIMTVEALRVYFGYINLAKLRAGQCELVRELLYLAIDPRNSPPAFVPGEAREALEAVDLVCGDQKEGSR